MSTTNRAFIKAYRQDAADQSPTAGAAPTIHDHASAPARATVHTATAVGGAASANPNYASTGPKLPLSSFITRPQQAASDARSDDNNILEPGTTIASFQWPKICRALSIQSGPQLDRVVDMLRAQADAGHSLIGIMGLFPRVGATTTSLCLAARAARRVQRAIVVDANLCHPRIAAWLDAVPTVGWEDVLKHRAPLSDAVIRATDDNLDVLALGSKPAKNPEPLAAGLQAAVTAGVLRHAYDMVLVDIGPFFDPKSQPIVLELVRNIGIDTVVGIIGSEPADPRDLATIAEYLEPLGCQYMGTIENRMDRQQLR
jgi:Mrp family chromosome partitioning ATPase